MLLVKWESWYGRFPARNRCEISFHTDDNIHPSKIIVSQRWNVRNSREQKSAKINFFFFPFHPLRYDEFQRDEIFSRFEENRTTSKKLSSDDIWILNAPRMNCTVCLPLFSSSSSSFSEELVKICIQILNSRMLGNIVKVGHGNISLRVSRQFGKI